MDITAAGATRVSTLPPALKANPTQPQGSVSEAAAEAVNLTSTASEAHPFEDIAGASKTVTVGTWGSRSNDSLERILLDQGYTHRDIYSKAEGDKTLLERVSDTNKLKNPNLIYTGKDLIVPVKGEASAAPPKPESQAEQEPVETNPTSDARTETEQSADKPKPKKVTVDAWGKGPNDSLEKILRNSGYSLQEIYGKDGAGKTMLERVAQENDLKSPDKIRAGQEITLPGGADEANSKPVEVKPEPVEVKPEPVEVKPEPEAIDPPKGVLGEPTAEMGQLLDGTNKGRFSKPEFQLLNAMANRYEETRAEYSTDGFSNEELQNLGRFERRYGAEHARLWERDDIPISIEGTDSTDPKAVLRNRHYEESGKLYTDYTGGELEAGEFIEGMMRQRGEARRQGGQ